MVRDVEGFRPELKAPSFRDPEVLQHREVHGGYAGTDQGVPAEIAECAQGLRNERARVEIQRRRSHRSSGRDPGAPAGGALRRVGAGAGDKIWTIRKARSRQLVLRAVGGVLDSERGAAREG